MDWITYSIVLTAAALTSLPSGFALGYLASERRTRDAPLLVAFGAAFLVGVALIWFVMRPGSHSGSVNWLLAAGFLVCGFGLGAVGGLTARVFGVLGWLIGIAAVLVGVWFAAMVALGFALGGLGVT